VYNSRVMARKKLSEFRAKTVLHHVLDIPYMGIAFDNSTDSLERLSMLDSTKTYVVKVDAGIKKRMKKGLVALDKTPKELTIEIKKLSEKGYSQFIIEPFVRYEPSSEKYFSIERVRDGLQVLYSQRGGIDVEENKESIKKSIVSSDHTIEIIASELKTPVQKLDRIFKAFNKYYFSFLEINPFVIEQDRFYLLDIASEVDSSAEFFVDKNWTASDFRSGDIKEKTDEEKEVDLLSQKSQASFNLTLLNENGSIFMLLSGGGASIVLADEVYNLGYGKKLANYGEYSGNPNAEETYLYTRNLLKLLLKSTADKKVLVIGGGVANFSDVRITFVGVIRALQEVVEDMKKQQIKVFVRRGGPHQKEGLEMMEKFLKEQNIFGFVGDQKTSLPEIIKKALQ